MFRQRLIAALLIAVIVVSTIGIAKLVVIGMNPPMPQCIIQHSHYAGFNSAQNLRHIIDRPCQ